jgi:hypothetical protein
MFLCRWAKLCTSGQFRNGHHLLSAPARMRRDLPTDWCLHQYFVVSKQNINFSWVILNREGHVVL